MIIAEYNQGPKIRYEIRGTVLDLDHRMMLDLAAYELDDENRILVFQDRRGCLLNTADREGCFVAEIIIPPRRYISDRKAVYEGTLPVVKKTPAPFDMDRCTLGLWAVE